jgi:hypothetical protein
MENLSKIVENTKIFFPLQRLATISIFFHLPLFGLRKSLFCLLIRRIFAGISLHTLAKIIKETAKKVNQRGFIVIKYVSTNQL